MFTVSISDDQNITTNKNDVFDVQSEIDRLYEDEKKILSNDCSVNEVIRKIIITVEQSEKFILEHKDSLKEWSMVDIEMGLLPKKIQAIKSLLVTANEKTDNLSMLGKISNLSRTVQNLKSYVADDENLSRYLKYVISLLSASNTFIASCNIKNPPSHDKMSNNQFHTAISFREKPEKERDCTSSCIIT